MSGTSLDTFVNRLTHQDMPVFAQSVKNIQSLSERDNTSLSELANVVLQDAALTARMLMLANSVHFNKGYQSVNTISRAVVMLGFDSIRTLCMSISLIETLLNGAMRDQVVREMALAFHAATQARKLISFRNEKLKEQVFIAAVLYRLGPIAFWCFGGEHANRLEDALKRDTLTPPARIEQEVLGFRLQQLTIRLSKEWRLSELLDAALAKRDSSDTRIRAIDLGYKVAHAAQHGWSSVEAAAVTKSVADYLNLPEEEARSILHETAREAIEIAANHGMATSSRLIPLPDIQDMDQPVTFPPEESGITVPLPVFPEPDQIIQLNVLRDLSTLMQDAQIDVNLLFSLLLEGIYRGIGMDRVMLAILTQDRTSLRGKFGLGWENQDEVHRLFFQTRSDDPNLFSHVLRIQKPLWIKQVRPPDLLHLLKPEIVSLSRNAPFFVMPILARGQSIGLVYADRALSKRLLDEESYSSFCFFCHQASLCLSAITR
ncbi:MAG: HDOD domain-containing protein [Syntrophobacteraceae bacterium]|nr:HDOD domain-containing protein [Syntrophobacteraceae bacterium]